MSLRLQRISRALEANSSTSLHLQHASRASRLHTSTPPRLHAYSTPPDLYTSSSPGLRRTPPDVYTSTTLHVYTSTSPGPQHASRAADLLRQTPPRLHACSPPPYLLRTTPTEE